MYVKWPKLIIQPKALKNRQMISCSCFASMLHCIIKVDCIFLWESLGFVRIFKKKKKKKSGIIQKGQKKEEEKNKKLTWRRMKVRTPLINQSKWLNSKTLDCTNVL